MFHFHFRGLQDRKELGDLLDFLRVQDLSYPNYEAWVERTEAELDSGYKGAVLAFSEAKLVGDLIYQPHKEISCFLELKNMRIHPQLRERKFAEFMLKQVEVENREKYDAIIVDARANQKEIIGFMESQGYETFATLPLYHDSVPDVVMIKYLDKNKEKMIYSLAGKIVRNKAV